MKKALFLLLAVVAAVPMVEARPGGRGPGGPGFGPGGPRGGYGPPPPPRHHHSHTWHGRDWGAFGAGVLIGTATRAILPPPPPPVVYTPAPTVVYTAPTVVTPAPVVVQPTTTVVTQPTQVWVEGYWRVTNDANGRPVSRTWVEGHWETR